MKENNFVSVMFPIHRSLRNKIVVSNTMKLTLACDHRTVDGVTGSLFLETLKGYIENPVTILV